ncbi:MAG: YCF48-related protein [Bacteroidia bacterium]
MNKIIKYIIILIAANAVGFPTAFAQWLALNSGTTARLHQVYFVDETIGFAIGGWTSGLILKTENAGETWNPIYVSNMLYSINFISDSLGYVAGEYGLILKTSDKGNNWVEINSPTSQQINTIHFIDSLTGFIGTGGFGGAPGYGKVYKTIDGCINWVEVSPDLMYVVKDIYFRNNTDGVMLSGIYCSATSDTGNTWQVDTLLFPNTIDVGGQDISFMNNTLGFMTGGAVINNTLNAGAFLKTIDGGNNWALTVFDSIYRFQGLFMIDENIGYIIGSNQVTESGTILKTIDGGETWRTQINSGLPAYMFSVFCTSSEVCYAVGDDGVIIKTVNGGVGIHEADVNEDLRIYPNPAANSITLEIQLIGQQSSVKIYDVRGQQIFETVNNKQKKLSIDVSGFAAGLYVIQLQSQQGVVSKKFMKR